MNTGDSEAFLRYRRGKSYRTNSQHMRQYWRFSLITTHKTLV